MWKFEKELFDKGINIIAGVDEAGRGPLAGPVVAAAVIIPRDYNFKEKIDDSKKLSPILRERAFQEIENTCQFAYSILSEQDIDRDNIFKATLRAMVMSVDKLPVQPEWVLVDGPWPVPSNTPCTPIIDGDAKCISISCASIVAKVTRDRIMMEYDKEYPVYGFAEHKGYGTKAHMEALTRHGPCPIHRRSFQPIKKFFE